ncbi:MAG: phosphoribosyltransferase [Nitrosomonadales bacterium SCN 54-20]|nr:MAG: phosphoribosyltransferase [Nitrosomonadales bacterium SCN 54-20]
MNYRLKIVQSLFGRNCLLCGSAATEDLCAPCRDSLPHISGHHCPVCALPMEETHICGACLAHPPAFDRTLAAVNYAFPIDALLHSLKYRTNLALAPVLADLLLAQIDTAVLPDFIVPMPLHAVRLRERGFNQAMEISRQISKKSDIPLLPTLCHRVRDTASQTGLPWKEREKNIRNAFDCEGNLDGKRIAIVDDVMTTGATLNELARVLRKCGAVHISAWVVARTLPGTP